MVIIKSYLREYFSILQILTRTLTCMKFILLVILFIAAAFSSEAQDFSNKGKDFWVGYGYHERMIATNPAGGPQDMVLYFATEAVTTITVTIPGIGYSQTFSNIPANTIFETPPLPKSGTQDARLLTEGKFDKGIHIVSDKPVVAYAHIYNMSVSGATLLFPTITLGKEYYSVNYKNTSNSNNAHCWFYVCAADTGITTIEITPSAATLTHPANVPFTVDLKQGEIYNVMGQLSGCTTINGLQTCTGVDLTGSKIKSISTGPNGCKRIAVFSGSGRISLTCTNSASSSDNYMVQSLPKTAWGQKYLTASTGGNQSNNFFRICVSDPSTVVKVNSLVLSPASLVNNFYYEIGPTNAPNLIEADKPIMVAQYLTSQGACGNGNPGDPEVIYLSSVEQNINKVILNSTNRFAITQHFINVIIPNSGSSISSFRIDGNVPSSPFIVHPQNAGYSYLQEMVTPGSHTLQSDSGFNAIAYGYGNAESYGYNAGTNVKDLYQFIGVINKYAIVNQPSACAGSPFYFSITLPYQPVSLFWDFKGSQSPNITQNNPIPDSTYVINGKQVWRYSINTPSIYAAGTYPITVISNNPTPEGCTGEQFIDFDLNVYNPPSADFSFQSNGCLSDSVGFQDITNYVTGTFSYKWHWDFGDGNTASIKNPKHKYAKSGVYTVKLSLITNVGCLSDTVSKQITITDPPVARFGISSPLCIGKSITFSDSSFAPAPGNLVKWFWDFGDGTIQNLTAGSNPVHTYSTTGTFNVTLKVENNAGCQSTVFTMPVNIHPNPAVNFSLPGICLPSGFAQFLDSTTIADGSQSQFTYQWNFGDPPSGSQNTSTLQNPAHNYSNTGPFTVQLQVSSKDGCKSDTTKILSTVYPQPKAAFTVKTENCLNDTTYFTDQSNGQGSTLTNWFWDFGDGQSSIQQNPVHVYTAAGTYTVSLYIKTDKSCFSDTVKKQVTINLLPTASFATTSPLCETKDVTFTNASAANAGNLNKWNWNLGDGSLFTVTNDNPFTHSYTSIGNFTVTLSVESDKGCKSPVLFRDIIVNSQPLPGFISPDVCLTDAFAQFTDTTKIASGTITSWAWDFGDPSSGSLNTATVQNPKHKYNSVGIYNVTLTVTSNNGCLASITKPFTVNGAVPKADFTIINNSGLCSNKDVQIQNTSSVDFGNITKVEIYWDLANDPSSFDADNSPVANKVYTHLYQNFQTPLNKTYQVKLRSYSGILCVDEITKTITINASPLVQFLPIADTCFNINPFAIGQASETGGVPGSGTFTGPGISNGSNMFNPSAAGVGTHTIRYTFTSGTGCIDYKEQTITIYPIVNVNAGPDRTVLEDATITLEPTVSGNALQYLWTPNQYLNNNTILNPVVSGVQDITYVLTVTGTGGCIFSDQVFVKVLKFPNIPNTFTPNNDGINDTWIIQNLSDYPNVRLQVFNRYGQVVFESKGYTKPWDGTMNGKSMPFGTYYYVIEPGNGRKPVTGYVTIIK